MTKKKKVAIIHYSGPPVIGGVERVIEDHIQCMVEDGYEIKLIVGKGKRYRDDIEFVLMPEIFSTEKINMLIGDELESGVVSDIFKARKNEIKEKLMTELQDCTICIIHQALSMHFCLPLTAALDDIIAEKPRIKFVNYAHDTTLRDPVYFKKHKPEYPYSLLKKFNNKIINMTVSHDRAKEFADVYEVGIEDIEVVPNGVNIEKFLGIHANVIKLFDDYHLNEKNVVFFYPTRIVRRKKIERALAIIDELKEIGQNVTLIISGPADPHNADAADYWKSLQDEMVKRNLIEDVIYLQETDIFKDVEDEYRIIRDIYMLSDALLFTSEREGFGIPLIEAGLLRLPVICSNLRVFKEIGQEYIYYIDDYEHIRGTEIVNYICNAKRYRFYRKIMQTYTVQAAYRNYLSPLFFRES